MSEDGAAPAAGPRMAPFGRWLAQERELRGLARAEVARLTKLPPGVIEALESGDEVRMPPRAYCVGYLRAYAAAAGLDADEVVLRFEEAAGPAEAPRRRAPPRVVVGAGALALVAAAAALAWWVLAR